MQTREKLGRISMGTIFSKIGLRELFAKIIIFQSVSKKLMYKTRTFS